MQCFRIQPPPITLFVWKNTLDLQEHLKDKLWFNCIESLLTTEDRTTLEGAFIVAFNLNNSEQERM
jgi:hypothetical protein